MTNINLEAIMPEQPAPVVNVTTEAPEVRVTNNVPPAEVTVNLPDRKTETTVVRDGKDNIVKTVQLETSLD